MEPAEQLVVELVLFGAIDRRIASARTRQATDPVAANELWARIDRELTD